MSHQSRTLVVWLLLGALPGAGVLWLPRSPLSSLALDGGEAEVTFQLRAEHRGG